MTRLGICAFVCAIFVQGCGGGSSSVPVGQVKDSEINEICDRLVRCGAVADKAFCVAAYEQIFNDSSLTAGVANGSISYDDKLAGECLDALGGASCDPSSQDNRVEPQACKDAIKGNRHMGDACYFDTQCSSDSCNITNTNCGMACCAGTCNADPPTAVAIGQSCATAPCVDGAYCNSAQTCAALVAIGGTCTGDSDCAYGSVCAGSTTLACAATPKAGDACLMHNGGNDCVVTGLICDSTTHCAALLDKGATCDPQAPLCKEDLMCDPTSMKCVNYAADGAACSQTQPCAPPDHCAITGTTGTCTAPSPTGTACTNSSDCQSDNCDTTTNLCAAAAAVCS
jgi:hypothetical protein